MNIEKELKENPKAFEKIDYETYKEHVVVRNDSYRPFSNEWKESLMELTKEQLVEQLKNNIIENMQLKETQIGKANQVERLVMPTEAEPQDGGWISVKDRLPDYIKDKDYSENVLTTDGENRYLMARCYLNEAEGWLWGMVYGGLDDDAEVDDDYSFITHWQPLPKPPLK